MAFVGIVGGIAVAGESPVERAMFEWVGAKAEIAAGSVASAAGVREKL